MTILTAMILTATILLKTLILTAMILTICRPWQSGGEDERLDLSLNYYTHT